MCGHAHATVGGDTVENVCSLIPFGSLGLNSGCQRCPLIHLTSPCQTGSAIAESLGIFLVTSENGSFSVFWYLSLPLLFILGLCFEWSTSIVRCPPSTHYGHIFSPSHQTVYSSHCSSPSHLQVVFSVSECLLTFTSP